MRKQMAGEFAKVFEHQVKLNHADLMKLKEKVIDRDTTISGLRLKLAEEEAKVSSLRATHKKIAKVAL
jgi:hypothetical protein